ncbi:MAG: hypothetical protein ACREEC_00305 [Thermoplasmata archaeon]
MRRIAADERLLELNDDVLHLPAAARRGIALMVQAVVAEGTSSRSS